MSRQRRDARRKGKCRRAAMVPAQFTAVREGGEGVVSRNAVGVANGTKTFALLSRRDMPRDTRHRICHKIAFMQHPVSCCRAAMFHWYALMPSAPRASPSDQKI